MDIPATIAAEAAITRQNVALSNVKHSADQAELFAKTIEETIASAPISESRGASVDLFA